MKKTATLFFALLLSFSQLQATVHIVNVADVSFAPANLNIVTGDVVRWVWVSGVHTVTSNTSAWTEATLDGAGDEFSHTFNTAGSFHYVCRFHEGMGMVGSVSVTAAVAAPEGQETLSLLKISPNPARNQLFVSSSVTGFQIISVLNALGQELISETKYFSGTKNEVVVNVAGLAAGSYIIVLQNKEGILAKNHFLKAN